MEDHGKRPSPLWSHFLSYNMKMVIPAPEGEGEGEGEQFGSRGHRGWESLVPAPERGQEMGRPREGLGQEQGLWLCHGRSRGPRASEQASGVIRDLDVLRSLKDRQQRREESPGCGWEERKAVVVSRGPLCLQRSPCLANCQWTRSGKGRHMRYGVMGRTED